MPEIQDLVGVNQALDNQVPRMSASPHANVRVPFGDLPNQVLPLDWAESFIRIIYAEHPGVFRSILPRLYGLPAEEPKRRRSS